MKIVPPVSPYRGVRGLDSWGAGNFGASRDGGGRQHAGLDFLTVVGDTIVAPIPCRVTHVGVAYADSTLGSVHLLGEDEFAGWAVKMLYLEVLGDVVGKKVPALHHIGHAQDVAGYWKAKRPDHAGEMRNHIHVEIRITEPRLVDPAHYLPEGLTVDPGLRA